MSFCIRSISNSSRYAPTFVNVQGCNTRRFGSRQLLKQVNSISTSNFLNEFLGLNTLQNSIDNRDEYKLSNGCQDSLNNIQLQLSVQNSEEINEISTLSSIKSLRNSSTVNREKSFIGKTSRINSTDVNLHTKNDTKVRFSLMTKPKITLEPSTLTNASKTENNANKNSSNEDLEHIYNTLSIDLPEFFTKPIDYKIYNPEIEFVNNIKGTVTKGMYNYFKQMVFLRTFGHLKFAFVKFEVIKITMHTSDNTVKVRWRIVGLSGMKIIFAFWKYKVWKLREKVKEEESWYDGFSTFYVGNDGLIYKHVADKVMPNDHEEEIKPKGGISSKLASQLTFSNLH